MEITDKTSKVNIQFDPISVHERKFRWYFGLLVHNRWPVVYQYK